MSIDGDWKVLMRALSIQAQAVPFSKGTTQQEKDAIADYMIGIADMIEAYPVPQYIRSISEAQEHCLGRLKAAELQIATEKTQYGCLKIQEQAALKERDNALLQIRELERQQGILTNALIKSREQVIDLATKAKAVMQDFEEHGGGIWPHLSDTDDNDGQYLRKAIEKVLGPIHWGKPETDRLIAEERRLGAEVRCDCGVPGCNKLYDHRK